MKINLPPQYRLVHEEKLNDINGFGVNLVHIKSGARLALIKNEDTNKVFCIGFRTPPKDSTGVAHIIEHSVLCGSKNFPAKNTFVELAGSSLNTYLNAATYPDRTVYPVASQNNQDFKNLMHVYMDAVLYPIIYNRKEIFNQEAWHYSLENEADELKINGVVYNEMKGVFSSPEQQLVRMNQNTLFQDTCYGVESGGDPDYIPELSYEEFLEFHRTYYHPSNSYIYLYGDMDFEERLIWLDKEYLSHFDYMKVDSEITVQKGFDALKEVDTYYSLGEEDVHEENTYLSLNIAVGGSTSNELILGLQILDYILFDIPGAPVKQALLDASIGKDILSHLSVENLQPMLSIIAKNSEEDRKEKFLSVIHDALSELVNEGLNERTLNGAINLFEFKYREADYGSTPKGLVYGLRVMRSWIYNDDEPFQYLKDGVLFEKLRQNISSRYFEKLISDHLLNNNHKSLVILKPKAGLNGINEMKLKESLSAYKDTLSGDELRTIVEETKNLKLYQETPSTQEEIDSIPMLTRDDIGSDPQPLYNEEMNVDGTRVIHHDVFTNEIVYLRLLFDVKDVPKELIPYLSLLSLVVGNVDTDNYSYLEYSNEVNLYTGGIDHNVISFSVKSNTGDYLPMYEIRTKVMYDKLPEAYRLIEEVINHTQIKDYKRLKEIIDEMKSRLQMIFLSSTHSIAVTRAMSYYSKHGMFKEATQGISFYQFLENISTNYGELKDEIISKLKTLMELIFTKDKLLVSVTADKRGYEMCMKSYSSFIQVIRKSASERLLAGYDRMPLAPKCLNEGFKAAMQVQYVARAGNYFKAGYEYTGALKVLRTILSYDYLWHNVRVKGGAYGCMCGFSGVDGDVYFTSYRDPGLRSTNETYENIPEFIKHYVANDRDITKSIISTISTLDIPLTPQTVGARSLSMFLAGITYEDLKREREEIINVTQEDIRALHGLIRSVLNEGNICVIGNENKIEEDRDLFKEVKNLM